MINSSETKQPQIPVNHCAWCGSYDLGIGWQQNEAIVTLRRNGFLGNRLKYKHSRNILKVFYPTGAAHGLTARCAVARHGPSRVLGPCPKKLDGLSCMHQLFPG